MPNTYFPLIFTSSSKPKLGVQVHNSITPASIPFLASGGFVKTSLDWSSVEKVRGEYVWPTWDADIKELSATHDLLLLVWKSPEWARRYPATCSPPHPEFYVDYLNFILAVIDRYHPKYVEIWNEPNVSFDEMPEALYDYMGCWGYSIEDGIEYAEMLAAIFAHIKITGTMVIGGQLIAETKRLEFWKGATNAGITMNLDWVSYHSYVYEGGSWDTPMIDAQKILAISPGVPLILSETSLLYYDPASMEAEQHQADYLSYLLSLATGSGIDMVNWFAIYGSGWNNCDLVADGKRKKPAWNVYNENCQQ